MQEVTIKKVYVKPNLNSLIVEKINLYSCFYICLWTLLPLFRSLTNQGIFQLIFVVIAFLWLVSSLLISRKWIEDILIASSIGSIYIIMMIVYYIFNYGNMQLTQLVAPLFLFLYSFMSCFYLKLNNNALIKKILLFIAVCYIITAITTIYGLIDNLNVARLMTSSSTSANVISYLENRNIAGFDFIYGTVLLIPLLFTAMKLTLRKSRKNIFEFLLLTTIFILALTGVALSNFTTAYLLMIIAIFFSFIISKNNIYLILTTVSFIIIIILPFIQGFAASILMQIQEATPSIMTQEKIGNLISAIYGESSIQSASVRSSLLENSLQSFLANPIHGIGAFYNDFKVIGGHSQFIDDLGRYGLIGAVPFFIFLILVLRKSYNKIVSITLKNTFVFCSFLYIILGFLNPVLAYNISFAMFFILPLMSKILQSKKNYNNKNTEREIYEN